MLIGIRRALSRPLQNELVKIDTQRQGSRTYGTRTQNGTREDFLGTRYTLLSISFISYIRQASLYCEQYVCMYTHISYCVQTANKYPWLPNNMIPRLKHFYTNQERCEGSNGYLFIIGLPAWR